MFSGSGAGACLQVGKVIVSNTWVDGDILETLRSATNQPGQQCDSRDAVGRDEQAAYSSRLNQPHALDPAHHQHARDQPLRVPDTNAPALDRRFYRGVKP